MKRETSRPAKRRPGSGSAPEQITTATPRTIRQVNRSILLNLIRLHQPISRAELSRLTGMHRSNVSVNIEELTSEGLLREERSKPGGRGRVPFLLYVSDDAVYVLVVNLRVSETTVALGQLSGKIEKVVSFATPEDPELFVAALNREIRRLLISIRPNFRKAVRNLIVSVPGHVRFKAEGDIWIPALPRYAGFFLRAAIESKIGIPTDVMNNAGLGALAEMRLHEMRRDTVNDFIFLLIGDVGTGAGIIFDQQLYLGHDRSYAGEFGHMVIDQSGLKCSCGKHGCWQLYVCDRATWQRYRPTEKFTPAKFQHFLQKAKQGDARAVAALNETVKYLALGISNICEALNPELIILSGEISTLWDLVHSELMKQLSTLNTTITVRRPASNVDHLVLQGAIHLGLRKVFDPQQ